MSKEIVIDISEDGEVRVETTGFVGESCLKETEFLIAILGKETHQELTPAYYIEQEVHKKQYLQLCG
jgi:hypothetical protein